MTKVTNSDFNPMQDPASSSKSAFGSERLTPKGQPADFEKSEKKGSKSPFSKSSALAKVKGLSDDMSLSMFEAALSLAHDSPTGDLDLSQAMRFFSKDLPNESDQGESIQSLISRLPAEQKNQVMENFSLSQIAEQDPSVFSIDQEKSLDETNDNDSKDEKSPNHDGVRPAPSIPTSPFADVDLQNSKGIQAISKDQNDDSRVPNFSRDRLANQTIDFDSFDDEEIWEENDKIGLGTQIDRSPKNPISSPAQSDDESKDALSGVGETQSRGKSDKPESQSSPTSASSNQASDKAEKPESQSSPTSASSNQASDKAEKPESQSSPTSASNIQAIDNSESPQSAPQIVSANSNQAIDKSDDPQSGPQITGLSNNQPTAEPDANDEDQNEQIGINARPRAIQPLTINPQGELVTTAPIANAQQVTTADRIDAAEQIVSQMASAVTLIEQQGQTETVVNINHPPQFRGVQLVVTEFDSATRELNLTFANVKTKEVQQWLDSPANLQKLRSGMQNVGIVLQRIDTTHEIDARLPEQGTFNDQRGQQSEGDLSDDEDQKRRERNFSQIDEA